MELPLNALAFALKTPMQNVDVVWDTSVAPIVAGQTAMDQASLLGLPPHVLHRVLGFPMT
jgi:hypothetical protein